MPNEAVAPRLAAFAALAVLLAAAPAWAVCPPLPLPGAPGVTVVTNAAPAGAGSLANAVAAVPPGGTIVFDPAVCGAVIAPFATLNLAAGNVALLGCPGAPPILSGAALAGVAPLVRVSSNGNTLCHLELVNAPLGVEVNGASGNLIGDVKVVGTAAAAVRIVGPSLDDVVERSTLDSTCLSGAAGCAAVKVVGNVAGTPHGIRVSESQLVGGVAGVVLAGGTNHSVEATTVVGPSGDGIRVEVEDAIVLRGNVVSGAGADGIVVDPPGGPGDHLLEDNVVESSAGIGIRLGPTAKRVRMHRNLLSGNGGCAIRYDPGIDPVGAPTVAEIVTTPTGELVVSGSVRTSPIPALAEGRSGRVEVFWGESAAAAAHYLGAVDVSVHHETYRVVGAAAFPAAGGVVTATFTDDFLGATSALGESCDQLDQDCDGVVDDGFDLDGDGVTTCAGDCDDHDPAKTNVDVDGDGNTTCDADCCEAAGHTLDRLDADLDGLSSCDGDPDDADDAVPPPALLGACDPSNGLVDPGFDRDADGAEDCPGVNASDDCDDRDPRIGPAAVERCGNGVDDDCDGSVDERFDADGDGRFTCADAGTTFDPDDASALPVVDGDGDADPASTDCDDGDPLVSSLDHDGDGVSTCAGDCDDGDPGASAACPARSALTHVVDVSTGTPNPPVVYVREGDTVEWVLPGGAPLPLGTIHEVEWRGDDGALCRSFPAHVGDGLDFTGPKVQVAPGLFLLSPDEPPYVDPDPTDLDPVGISADDFADPAIAGTFLRPQWKDVHLGPGRFDWSEVDRVLELAVASGKVVNLGFKAGKDGTPAWIFDAPCGCDPAAERLQLADAGSGGSCVGSVPHDYGNPMDPAYRCHYFALLEEAAAHLKSRSAWYRALAHVKSSGANFVSHENRLPNSCDWDCPVCNTEVWATAPHPYTPGGLYDFYRRQHELLAEAFPGKQLSYGLIQAGFPLVGESGSFETCADDPPVAGSTCPGTIVPAGSLDDAPACVGDACGVEGMHPECLESGLDHLEANAATELEGTDQTTNIVCEGRVLHGPRFTVQHNALAPLPAVGPGAPDCRSHGLHGPALAAATLVDDAGVLHDASDLTFYQRPVGGLGERPGCPSNWMRREAALGQPTGAQTVNDLSGLTTPPADAFANVRDALDNGYESTDAVFVELYENAFFRAVDGAPSRADVDAWTSRLVDRFATLNGPAPGGWDWGFPEPFPATYAHTFLFPEAGAPAEARHYVVGTSCDPSAAAVPHGLVVVLPREP